jgi:hypothetical protein
MRPLWDKGVADFKSSSLPEKLVVGAGGAIGGAVGVARAVPKSLGVAAFEYYDRSFGKSRGRDFFDYVTTAPIIHTAAAAAFAGALGAGFRALGVTLPPELGIATTLCAGAATYLGSLYVRTLPWVVGSTTAGGTGRGLSIGRELVERHKQPSLEVSPTAWKVASRTARAAAAKASIE